MDSDPNKKLLLLYMHDMVIKQNPHSHEGAEILARHFNPQDRVMIDTPKGFLSDWIELVREECRIAAEKKLEDISYKEFRFVWDPILYKGDVVSLFPIFFNEYCTGISSKFLSSSLHEGTSSSKAIQDAGNVPERLGFVDREIAKQALWKMTSDPRILEASNRARERNPVISNAFPPNYCFPNAFPWVPSFPHN